MTRGVSTTLPTQLPARFRQGFPWALDRRCKVVREVAADLLTLWQDLGGYEGLSTQQLWLCERVVFLRRRMLAYESAILSGTDAPMSAGEFSNFANVAQGHLKALGLQRQARLVDGLQSFLARASKPQETPAETAQHGNSSGDRAQPIPRPEVSP
jgi:hypothetical protein